MATTAAWLWGLGGYFCIIATHFHYSVDVWLGFCMTLLVWKGYHVAARIAPAQAVRPNSRVFGLDRLLFIIIAWLESKAKDLEVWHELDRRRMSAEVRFEEEIRGTVFGEVRGRAASS